jgi:hypothetical protein
MVNMLSKLDQNVGMKPSKMKNEPTRQPMALAMPTHFLKRNPCTLMASPPYEHVAFAPVYPLRVFSTTKLLFQKLERIYLAQLLARFAAF